jgi:tRNA pseudouridine13 synthase
MTTEERANGRSQADLAGPYLTKDLAGIGGAIKEQVEDFVVEELPLYAPSGEGQHTFFEIRKAGLSTFEAVRTIARALGVSPTRIGYAGHKDARAIACQVLSVEGIAPDAVTALDLPNIRVMWAERHRSKLKIGHLRGNRFTIRIRNTDESALPACQAILDVLVRRGVPNYFGPQRFGRRGNSARLGRAMVRRDPRGFVEAYLGQPDANESEVLREARSQFDAGHWAEALRLLPSGMVDERLVLQILIRTEGDYERAYWAVPKRLRTFLLSAYQSELFNSVLEARLETLDQVHAGDLAMIHPGHSVFRVEDEAAEQPRADRFEISPTGPLFGFKMTQALGRQGELEAAVLAADGLVLEDFRVGGGIQARGARRALRFQVHDRESWYDQGIVLRFWLSSGCYATALLAEIMKGPAALEPG